MNVIIDSCFWFSFLQNRKADHHEEAVRIYEYLSELGVDFIIPYPSLYETLNTRLFKEGHKELSRWMATQLVANENFIKIPDDLYRQLAFDNTVSPQNNRGISFVDNIIRAMIADRSVQIKALVTFNRRDFEDLCYERGVELIDEDFKV